MTIHLAARLVWNDRGWDGCICDDPSRNVFCTGQERVREEKRVAEEEMLRGRPPWDGDYIPPCTWDINAFSANPAHHVHRHPFIEPYLFAPVPEDIPPYTIGTWPYDLMYDDKGQVRPWREREANAARFFEALEPKKSLVFLYVTQHNPISRERPEQAGDYVLVGISRVLSISDQLRYDPKGRTDLRDFELVWSRLITYNYPEEGVRIPYQEYLRQGKDVEGIAVVIPPDLRPTFKFVGRHVTDDQACILVERAIDAIRQVQADGFVRGDWAYRLEWLNGVLAEVWKGRGPYPGIGAVLEYLGFSTGTTYLRQELGPRYQDRRDDLVAYIRRCLDGECELEELTYRPEMEKARRRWRRTRPEKRALLMRLCSFELSRDQILRILDDEERPKYSVQASLNEIGANPYLLCEEYLGESDEDRIGFERIDNGMFPSPALGIDPEIQNDDDRRVRALIIEYLRKAGRDGHTFVAASKVLEGIRSRCAEARACEVDLDFITADPEIRAFYEQKLVIHEEDGEAYFYLRSVYDLEREIRERVLDLLGRVPRPPSGRDWVADIRARYDPQHFSPEKLAQARAEQSRALENAYRQAFSVITGAAGTGKSSLLKLLIEGIRSVDGQEDFLVITPTGKAAVRLQREGVDAQTIHRALMRAGWINPTNFSLRAQAEGRIHASNIILDEASMVDVELLGALFRAVDWDRVKRLVLAGDPNQLPPIGYGRPFYDIIAYLKQRDEYQANLNELQVNCRLIEQDSSALVLASGFADSVAQEEEVLRQVARGGMVGADLEVIYWRDDTDLQEKLAARLQELLVSEFGAKFRGEKDYEWFNRLLGVNTEGYSADFLQILSPVRGHYFGTRELNRVIQKRYHGGLIYRVGAIGQESITWLDKVIQTVNTRKTAYANRQKETGYVFNGEIGLVRKCDKPSKQSRSLSSIAVEFEEDPGKFYYYNRTAVGDNLELAYAITTHKAQGSQFQWVFFIMGKEAATLCRELVYTALTRSRQRLVLFLQDDIGRLLELRRLDSASIIRRNSSLFTLQPVQEDRPFREGGLIHVAQNGIPMRSKSEVIIANLLLERSISFDYEKPLYGRDGDSNNFRLPDFTIYRAGEEWYWEHLGMLSDPDYRRRWDLKRRWYEANGYFERLVTTQDDERGGLDSHAVAALIDEKFGS